jgi:acetyl-CoA C-acetyltransferase
MLDRARFGYRLGHGVLIDGMYRDGFLCPLCNLLMGETAEKLAEMYGISREEQDEFAFRSQMKVKEAVKCGKFDEEIVPVEVKDRKGRVNVVSYDEHPRPDTSLEKLAKLRPVFREGGTVTAGNASGITDGAACVLLMSREKAEELGLEKLAKCGDYAVAGVDPSIMGIGVVPAVQKLLGKTGLSLEDFDLIELNEAFAAQVLACDRELHLPMDRVNVNGGAIALGHPIGCTGARIVVTLLYEMIRRDAKLGLATLCISGGMGMAMSFSRREI